MTQQDYIKHWRENAHGGNGCGEYNSFINHAAKLTIYADNFYAIDWRNRGGSSAYYVRYVFDGYRLYITGDLGSGIFMRPGDEPARRWLGGLRDFWYILEKLTCSQNDKMNVDDDVWIHDYNSWVKERNPPKKAAKKVRELWDEYGDRGFGQAVAWDEELREDYGFDFETLGSISRFGEVPHARLILWIEGLKLSYNQLGEELPK